MLSHKMRTHIRHYSTRIQTKPYGKQQSFNKQTRKNLKQTVQSDLWLEQAHSWTIEENVISDPHSCSLVGEVRVMPDSSKTRKKIHVENLSVFCQETWQNDQIRKLNVSYRMSRSKRQSMLPKFVVNRFEPTDRQPRPRGRHN